MHKCLILIFFLIISVSCSSEKKFKKNNELPHKKEVVNLYDLKIDDFPKKELILNDVNFIGYLDLRNFKNNSLFKGFLGVLEKSYFVDNSLNSLYFTVGDIYKSQEFLLFFKNYHIELNDHYFKKEQLANELLFKVGKTDNQEFGFVNFDNKSSVYGDTALIKELFNIYDKKVEAISNKRYDIFVNSNFLKSNADFKLFFMPNSEYVNLLFKFSEKQAFFKPFVSDLSYIFLEVELQGSNILNINLTISKKESVDNLFTFLNAQYKLLLTLNGTPYSVLNTKGILKNTGVFKTLKIEIQNKNSLKISIQINKTYLKPLGKFLNKIIGLK